MSDVNFDQPGYETEPPADSCEVYDLSCLGGWVLDQLSSFALWVFEKILNGMAAVIEAIPVPDFMQNVGSLHIPSSVAWFAQSLQLDTGMGIIVTAYTIRFIIRRLPVVG